MYKIILKLFESKYELTSESLSLDFLETAIYDYVNEVTTDLFASYEPNVCGYFPEPWKAGEAAYFAAKNYISEHKDEIQVYAYKLGKDYEIGERQTIQIDVVSIMYGMFDGR